MGAFRRRLYTSLEQLQADVDVWMGNYNAERTYSGKYCFGKTPLQTFLESTKLALDKQLDRFAPTAEPVATTAEPACRSDRVFVSSRPDE